MKKDLTKLFSRTLITYTFVLIILFIIKLIGLDYFGLDTDNKILNSIDMFLHKYNLTSIWYFVTLYIYSFIMYSIICSKKKPYKEALFITSLGAVSQVILYKLNMINISSIVEIMLWIITLIIFKSKASIKNMLKLFSVIFIYQLIILFIRCDWIYLYPTDGIIQNILQLDMMLLYLIYYNLYWKGVELTCGKEVGFSSLKQNSLKNSLKSFQAKSSKTKFETIVFTILSLLWNLFTLFIIMLIATLNDTLIECIIIVTSFMINKTVFGKPFHLPNAIQCFIVSNITYYCLNRITLPIGISFLVPLGLGVSLSYFTSKLVKQNEKILYKGMSEEDLKYYFDKVSNNKLDYKICKLYYVDRYKEVKIAAITNYSVENIKKRKRIINDKLKELCI